MPRTIAVGLPHDPGKGTVDLVLLPGEAAPEPRPGLTIHPGPTLPDVLLSLRNAFCAHEAITSLGSAVVAGKHEWTAAVETRLIEFLEDLGNTPIDSWQGARNSIHNGAALAAGSTTVGLTGALAGHPAICLGAGPSATPEALAKIAALQGSHYIFACDAMTHACQGAGIVPHFVTMLERVPEMEPLVLGADPRSTLIATTVIDPACTRHFQRHCWFWGGDDIYTWLEPTLPPSSVGRSSGTLSVAAALLAGCSPIYLVGHDLAYGPDDLSHSRAAHSEASEGQRQKDSRPAGGVYELTAATTLGYSGKPVRTNGSWNLMRQDIATLVDGAAGRSLVLSAQRVLPNGVPDCMGAEIAGVPAGAFPRPGGPAVPPINLPPSGIPDPTERIPGILRDLDQIEGRCRWNLDRLAEPRSAAELNQIAAALGVSRLVAPENVPLFRYVFRTISSGLMMRLHLRASGCSDPVELQRTSLTLLANTILAMARVMRAEIQK